MKGDIRFGGEKTSPTKKRTWGWGRGARSGALVDVSREIRRRDKTARTRKRELIVLCILLIIAGAMYIARQPFTFYRDVTIVGNKGVSQELLLKNAHTYLDSRALGMFPRASVFAFREDAFRQKLRAEDARIRDVAVNTDIFHHRIAVVITEYEPWAKWCGSVSSDDVQNLSTFLPCAAGEDAESCKASQQRMQSPSGAVCGFIGDDGVLFALTREEGNIPRIIDERANVWRVGDRVLEESWMRLVREWTREGALPQEYAIRTLTLKSDGSMHARTNEGWDVVGDATTDAVSSLIYLRTSLEQEIKDKRALLEYVDVRFGKKVFYKTRI